MMKSKKTRQEQRKKLRLLLLDSESTANTVLNEPGQTEYSFLHGQSQELSVTNVENTKKVKTINQEEESLSDDHGESSETECQKTAPFLKVKLATIPETSFDVKISDDDSDESSSLLFTSLKKYGVSKLTLKRMKDLGFVNMTDFQTKTIPALLEGRDLIAKLSPKCGQMIAYIIPALEILLKLDFQRHHGTGIIVLLPTQELIRNMYDFMKLILKPHKFNCCTLMSSNAREHETESLRQGVNFIVSTPGHLLYHMHNAPVFKFSNVQYLVLDEADRIAELGLHFELSQIVTMLPKQRQTLLFARNINKKTLELAEHCLKKKSYYVTDTDAPENAVDDSELQCVLCPTDKRFSFLYTLLRSKREKKVVVLFSSCLSAQYHYDILNYLNMSCLCIHGKENHLKINKTCSEFMGLSKGILLSTNAAAVDIELPKCHLVVQYEPPDDITEFLKRRGRVGLSAEAVLLLRPEEKSFFSHLRKANVPLKEIKLPDSSLMKIEKEVEPSVKSMYFLHKSSRDGYMAFIKAYAAHHLTSVFDVKTLDLVKVARSFGFAVPPYVDFDVHCRQAGKLIKRKQLENKKTIYAPKKVKKSKKSKHLRFRVPKTD